jgi:fructose-1-phosphate kinase PfkB-like protein
MRYIPKTVVEEQKNKMLIVTDGIFGVELFYNSQRYFVPSNVVEGLRDTIGAGDTFFAEYVSGLINNLEPERALARAVNETSDFLSQKSSLGLVEGSKRV